MSENELHESGNLAKNFYRDHQEIIEMAIPAGIKRIGESCFENCRNLRHIVIPDSVVGIHKRAFYGCESLEEVGIPDNLQNIAEGVFSGCVNLKQVTLPAGTRYVSNHAFAGCTSLEKVVLENNEIRISQTAFEGCTSLKFENALLLTEHFVKPLNILIHNGANGIEGRLRTFADRMFWFDGVECASIESVLEAFKFRDIDTQKYVAALSARDAYYEGQKEEAALWKATKKLYWKGTVYNRDGEAYQMLLDKLFQAIFEQDKQFRLDMAFLKNAAVKSKVGSWNSERTVLTKSEYISHLLYFSGGSCLQEAQSSVREANDILIESVNYERDPIAVAEKKKKTRKIVVMGGSFNPPTIAHEKLMLSAVDLLEATYGIFVPSSDSYVRRKMRKSIDDAMVLSEEERLHMLQKMCKGDPRLKVSTCEYQDDGRGHTYETMLRIQEQYPDALLYFLIGGDKLNIITRWHEYKKFFEQFDFAVVKRNGTEPEQQIEKNKMLCAYREIFHIIPEIKEISGINSTAVRKLFREENPAVKEMLNPDVYELLKKEGRSNEDITSFRGDYDFLSNFFEAGIDYNGIHYLNNEAAFQAQKCLTDEEKWEFSCLSAAKAKRKGRQVSLRADWEQVKIGIMEEIVRCKFTQNPYLADRLLNTGNRKLVEGNSWHDTCWGVDVATGEGENNIGKILMKIREELKDAVVK